LRSGETLAEAWAALDGLPVSGLLLNCSAPEAITAAMPALAALSDWPVGGYANGFGGIPDDWDRADHGLAALGHRDDLGPDVYAGIARDWLDAGARLIGGCCEIGPAHIARLRTMLRDRLP
jgi:S-methylmethionine-dependent homocysteine/selenocysteine methylase